MILRLYSVLLTVTILEIALLPVVRGARKVKLADLEGRTRYNVLKRGEEAETITSHLNLGDNVGLEVVDQLTSVQGNVKRKYRETYKGLKVYNTGLDVEEESGGEGVIVESEVYADLADDLAGTENCQLTNDEAEDITLSHFGKVKTGAESSQFEEEIYVDDNSRARDVIVVDLVNIKDGQVSRPHAAVDKCTREVLDAFDRVGLCATDSPSTESSTTAQTSPIESTTEPSPYPHGPLVNCDIKQQGGNPDRTFEYGTPGYCLRVKTSADGHTCILENEYVKGVDLKGTYFWWKNDLTTFTCSCGYDDKYNDGYSPTFDIFFFATKTLEMYREWYGYDPLADPVPYAKSHFGVNYLNAFWTGESLVFGDGNEITYPLAVLDVTAHELGHGVVQRASDLEYWRQSGGMNEAFADMSGEVAEEYVFGSNDWGTGYDAFKEEGVALRYFEDPTRDKRSIKHVDDYYNYMDVHYSSGVYNHAFWQLAHVRGLGLRAAYECFVAANRLYWRATSTFEEGACGVIRGAYDSGYDIDLVGDSFREVGIRFEHCPCFPDLVTAELKLDIEQGGLRVSKLRQPLFKFTVPDDTDLILIRASSGVSIAISQSYQRTSDPIESEEGLVVAWVNPGEVYYVRFFLDPSSLEDEIVDATAVVM